MEMQLTYKTSLTGAKPYNILSGDQYLSLLQKNERNIYAGSFGVYLARKVVVDDQELYQPLIDIDGESGLEGNQQIQSAIQFAHMTVKAFISLGAGEHFRILATGGTGFRAVSNLLFNRQGYLALVDWMRFEMPHIHDLKPTTETDIPHQIFAYKGDALHNSKSLTDSHSTLIDKNLLAQDAFTVVDYFNVTDGKPDPGEITPFIQWLLNGPAILDLNVLGDFGKKLSEYQQIANDFNVNPFSYIQLRNNIKPIGLSIMKDMLDEKGIMCMVEDRGKTTAISFKGYPCPMCGKMTVNARAYPPSYKLRCFNIHCEAYSGMPLHRWSGIKRNGHQSGHSKNGFNLTVPTKYESIEDARNLIAQELDILDNSLFVVTPGVGKTHSALLEVSKMGDHRTVIYAAFNKALQTEAYEKICELSGHDDGFFLLQSRDETCQRPTELKDITSKGFSPSEIICGTCEHRSAGCQYYNQRREFGPGVYFVTLHMLQYLQDQIPTPDLIILDENLKAGLLLEDTCTEIQIQSVLKVIGGRDQRLIMELLTIIHRISINFVTSDDASPSMIINGRKLADSNLQETTIIELLAKGMSTTEEDVISRLTSLSNTLDNLSRINLYRQGIDLNAISWIKGLTSPTTVSFVLIDKKGRIKFNMKSITPLGYPDTPIKILDATGDASAYRPLVRRNLKSVRANVAWNSHRVHVKINTSSGIMKRPRHSNLVELLTKMISYTQAKNIMFITYMRNEQQIADILESIDSTRTFKGFHFYGARGINSFQDCDAVLVVGLPYPNLNAAAQDACILFPDEMDADKRLDWAEACMQWDLVQGIHRIRPIHKPNVDIILAASNWPSILPTPNIVIDQSQNNNWKELAISRLTPFVETFGFLTQDIGFLANVYVKDKEAKAKEFQDNILKVIDLLNKHIFKDEVYYSTSTSFDWEKLNSSGCSCFLDDGKDLDELLKNFRFKCILVIYNLLNQNSLNFKNILIQLVDLINKQTGKWTNDALNLSNRNQWSDLLIHFKETNKHFEKFKIKLPHARGNYVTGVGNPHRVQDFYRQINNLGIVGKIDVESYQVVDDSLYTVNPIPGGYVSIYIPDDGDMAFVGWGSEIFSISLAEEKEQIRSWFEGILESSEIKIITNNGKEVAKAFLSCELPKCEIIDVVIAEKLIANGEIEYRCLNLKTIFKRNGLDEGLERSVVVHKLMDVWVKQQPLISSGGLETVFNLESRLVWITARIEMNGIGIDGDALLGLYDELSGKLDNLEVALRKMIPESILLNDRMSIKEHLNTTYKLSLTKIDEDSVKWISNQNVMEICGNLLEYWKITRECRDVELYISLTGNDGRVYDSIDQLNAKTGRFYRPLQTVQKDGPMRSLFRAKEGFKFIVADYSQQEARIIAGLSNDQVAIEMFKTGKDIYLETAKLVDGRDINNQWYRSLGKEIFLGLNNGRSAYSICESFERLGLGCDVDDVHGMILRFNMTFSGIQSWRDDVVSSAFKYGVITTAMGRVLKVSKDANVNSLFNYPVQGTAADGFKIALIYLNEQLAERDAQIVHILHDEVIIEARDAIADDVADTVKHCMEKAFKMILPNVPFVVEPEIRESWGY